MSEVGTRKQNPNPVVYDVGMRGDNHFADHVVMMTNQNNGAAMATGSQGLNVITAAEVYDYIRDIMDPEHPYTLEQLKVVESNKVHVADDGVHCLIVIEFTPTVPHCSLATLIGLCMREKLDRNLGRMFKLDIFVTKGKHSTEAEINKQVNDKERVAAALENPNLFQIVEQCIRERG